MTPLVTLLDLLTSALVLSLFWYTSQTGTIVDVPILVIDLSVSVAGDFHERWTLFIILAPRGEQGP